MKKPAKVTNWNRNIEVLPKERDSRK